MFAAKHANEGTRRRRYGPTKLTIISLLAVFGTVRVSSPAAAAPTCASAGITVTPLHGSTFYTDDSPSPPSNPKLTGGYEGFKFTNSTGAALNGAWSQVDTFNAGSATSIIGRAPGEDGVDQLSNLSIGASDNSYFFLQASPAATDSNAQTHTVHIFDSRPDLPGAVELCSTTFTYTRVISAIQAAANKVDISTVTSNPPGLGAIMVMTVTGDTGTIGSGEVLDPDSAFFQMGPATVITGAAGISGWRPDVFELIAARVKIDLGDGAGSVDHLDFLKWKFTGTPANQPYIVVYSFRIVGTTTSNINPSPVQNISSGTQTKHTDLSNFGSAIQPIQPAVNGATITKSANPVAVGNQSSTNVTYTVSATNNGAVARTVTDGVTTNNSTTVVSATANFTGNDIGKAIVGTGIAAGSAIVSVTNATTVVITSSATSTGSGRTLTIGTSQVAVFDSLVDTLPAGVTFVNNSAQFNAVAIGNPAISASTLTFVGPFTLPAASTVTLTYQVSFPAGITPGARTNSVVGYIGSAVIDTTVSTTDNVPATSTVMVVAPPVADDDAYITALNTPLVESMPGVLGNDSGTGITITSNTDPSDGVLVQNGDGSFTYTPNLNFIGSDSYTYTITDSVGQTATATVEITVPAARLTLNKSLPSRANSADQVTVSILNGASPVDSATTVGADTSATTGANTVDVGTFTLSEAMAAGSVSSIGQYTNSISCTNSNATSTTVLPAGPGTSFTVTPQADDDIACTFTNTPQSALVRIMTSTVGGVGGFDYSMSNLSSAATTVTTAIGTNPASSTAFTATALNTNTLITETVPVGWEFTSATCSDANAAVTGNPTSFGTVAPPAISVPASNMRSGANITCSFINTKLAKLTISKTAIGGAGTFDYTTTGLTPASFSLSPNPPTTPTVSQAFGNLTPGTYTVTELALAGFRLADITCADLAGGATGSTNNTTVASGSLTVTLVAGADYNCTYTNINDADVSVIKNTVGGDGTFTFTTTGTGNTSDPAPSIATTLGTGSSALDVPFGLGTLTRAVTITEDGPPAGWVLTAIACTDAASALVGTVDLPTRSATFDATPGAAISCRFTNEKLPTVVIRTQSVGGTATFDFSGGTNGLPASLALNTATSNPISSGPFTLTALNTATSITETVPTNYTLTSAVCVDQSATPVSTSLAGGTLTIDASAVVGGADLTCLFTNTRKSAQISLRKSWIDADVGDQATLSSAGGSNNPNLVSVADTINEVDVGAAVTVYAGETVTLSESFDVGSATDYLTNLVCTGSTDTDPTNFLAIVAADDGANIVCTFTNTGLAEINAVKSAGSVTGPDASGVYTVIYPVTVINSGITTALYGPLIDTTSFDPNLVVTGASWTTSGAGAPAGDSVAGTGPFTLASAGSVIGSGVIHTFNVSVTFTFATYSPVSACGGAASGLSNDILLSPGETSTADNSACVPPPAPPAPSLSIAKSATPTTYSTVGDVIAYSITVRNSGNVTLTAIDVDDPIADATPICSPTVLAPTEVATCTAQHTVTQVDLDAGSVVNIATGSGMPPSGSAVSDQSLPVTVLAVRSLGIEITKATSTINFDAAGDVIVYSFTVRNTGNAMLSSILVSDPVADVGSISCPQTSLPPAPATNSMVCTAQHTATQADLDQGEVVNTATAISVDPIGAPVTATSNTVQVPAVQNPALDVVKASSSDPTEEGDIITYSVTVTNTGNVTLDPVSVSDPVADTGSISCPQSNLPPAPAINSMICTAQHTVNQADVDTGEVRNIATAMGTPPLGGTVQTPSNEVIVSIPRVASLVTLKSTTITDFDAVGDVVTYTITVTNTGNVTLDPVVLSDNQADSAPVCDSSILAPGDVATCSAQHTIVQIDLDAGSVVNIASATGTPPIGSPVSDDSAPVVVPAIANPGVLTVKTLTAGSPNPYTSAGQLLNYTITVTNTGNVTLTGVSVSDPNASSPPTCSPTTLAPGGAATCTAQHTVDQTDIDAGSVVNVAFAFGTPPIGPAVSAQSNTITIPAVQRRGMTLTKTLRLSDRNNNESGDAGEVVTYTIVATNTGNVTLVGVTVSDQMLPTLTCSPSQPAALASGQRLTCTGTHTISVGEATSGLLRNVATGSSSTVTETAVATADLRTTGRLPSTGSDPVRTISLAFLTLLAGVAMVAVSRRRRFDRLVRRRTPR